MKAILHSHDILFPFARANHLVRLLRGEEVSRNLFAKQTGHRLYTLSGSPR